MKSILLLAVTLLGVTFSFAQNVGIGAPSPEVKLHVIDTFDVADGASGAFINVQNATVFSPVGTLSGIRFKLDGVNSGTNSRYKGGILFQKTSSFGVGSLLFATNSTGNNSSITAADAKMIITSTGNIGIGTTTPTTKLHVNGSMVIGAGSINPATGYSLSVDGKLICEEARVQISGSWPDYVFNDDYKLRPLDELEKLIRVQKHLPNIPSAAQVEKEGFDLGGMNKKLLEKVEELTLYIIELSKDNKVLNERIKKLEEK